MNFGGGAHSKTKVSLAVWKNIALPSLLYGTEVMYVSRKSLEVLDCQQCVLGKWLLGVPYSTANAIVEVDLGLRPVSEQIYC